MLTFIDGPPKGKKKKFAICSCGKEGFFDPRAKSCGCSRKTINITHEYRKERKFHKIYRVWLGMKERYSNPRHVSFHNYGGRGITVCDEWLTSFEAFKDWALNNGYEEGLSLDRYPDNNGPYAPFIKRIG